MKVTAQFTFHGRLNFFLQPDQHNITLTFAPHQSLKHLIESWRIPHVEVGVMLANGQAVDGSYRPREGDALEIFPTENCCPLEVPKFALDGHLGRLAAHLRMLGFDTFYQNQIDDEVLAKIAINEERILLSRDRLLLMRKSLKYGYCPRSLEPDEQIVEVIERFQLIDKISPFKRCLKCNALLEPIDKSKILDKLEPLTKQYFDEFAICTSCGQIYWKGSHYERMQRMIERIKST